MNSLSKKRNRSSNLTLKVFVCSITFMNNFWTASSTNLTNRICIKQKVQSLSSLKRVSPRGQTSTEMLQDFRSKMLIFESLWKKTQTYSWFLLCDARDDATSLRRHDLCAASDQREVVTAAKALLQKDGGAAATHLPVGDDGNAIAQDVGLVHVVCGQDDRSTCR